jgi:hypothetical protein
MHPTDTYKLSDTNGQEAMGQSGFIKVATGDAVLGLVTYGFIYPVMLVKT